MAGRSDKLSDEQQKELSRLEKTIEKARAFEFEAGYALRDIRDNDLWPRRYRNFGNYCKIRWDISGDTAYDLINACSVMDVLSLSGAFRILPSSIAQCSCLMKGAKKKDGGPLGHTRKYAWDEDTKAELVSIWADVVKEFKSDISGAKISRVVSRYRQNVTPAAQRPGIMGENYTGCYIGHTLGATEIAKRLSDILNPDQIDDLIGELLTISRGLKKAA
jgi:hypothetical protein